MVALTIKTQYKDVEIPKEPPYVLFAPSGLNYRQGICPLYIFSLAYWPFFHKLELLYVIINVIKFFLETLHFLIEIHVTGKSS